MTGRVVEGINDILAHWIVDPEAAALRPVDEAGSFSGALLWRLTYRERELVLRRWPEQMSADRVAEIHSFQTYLAKRGLPVPEPVCALGTGQSTIVAGGACWELATWMPGAADYWHDPRPEKLDAALQLLARVHRAAEEMPRPDSRLRPRLGYPSGIQRRDDGLHKLLLIELPDMVRAAERAKNPVEQRLIGDALRLIEQALPAEIDKSLRWRNRALPLAMCLRDVWHDHVLFTGRRVTGLIDFGAVGDDAPAGDVARLLGSLVADDQDLWRRGLAAYESVRPMTSDERDAVRFYDTSGTLLSAGRWIVWLWPKPGQTPPTIRRRVAALARLARLVDRLRTLVHGRG